MEREKYIYKYSPVDEFTLKNLILSQLWFNPPDRMNDQLEGLVKVQNVNFKPSDQAIDNFIKSNFDDDFQFDMLKIANTSFLDFYMNYWLRVELTKYRICCFSKTPIESLMWAHYANKHSGVCLVYDRSSLEKSLKMVHSSCQSTSIRYGMKPTITLTEKNKVIESSSDIPIISTKAPNWKYEREFRFFLQGFDGNSFSGESIFVTESALRAVIYGYHISEEDKDTISVILKNEPLYKKVVEYNEAIDYKTGKIYIEKD